MRSMLLIAGFVSLVFIAGLYRASQTSESPPGYDATWVVARALPRNHQIRAGDLVQPAEWLAAGRLLLQDETSKGLHLRGPDRKPGEVLTRDDLSPRPDLTPNSPGDHVYFYVVKEDHTPLGGWNAGKTVIPCYKTAEKSKERTVCIHTPLPILAVHKSTMPGEASWLALEVPEKLRCTFAEFALAEKRLLLQVRPR